MNSFKSIYIFTFLFLSIGFITSCNDDDTPPDENMEEIITDVTLTFTPTSGMGTAVTATAQDPDGAGAMDLVVNSGIQLEANTAYTLSIDLQNSIEMESITDEIAMEDDEHMFFFAWTDGLFSDPAGDGNADNRSDAVNYQDMDANNQPLGLMTTWTTGGATMTAGTFRVVLKHQPGAKTATSTVDDGDSDVDLTWAITIQ